MNNDITAQVMSDVAAQRRFERDLLRREVNLLRAYTIANGEKKATMYFWHLFSPRSK